MGCIVYAWRPQNTIRYNFHVQCTCTNASSPKAEQLKVGVVPRKPESVTSSTVSPILSTSVAFTKDTMMYASYSSAIKITKLIFSIQGNALSNRIFEFAQRYNNIFRRPRLFETAHALMGTERVDGLSFYFNFCRTNRLLLVPISRRGPYLSVIQSSVGQPIARWHPERENWCLIRVYQATRFINIVLQNRCRLSF